jgi:hypothetical protein
MTTKLLLVCATPTEAKPLRRLLSRHPQVQCGGGTTAWNVDGMMTRLCRTGISTARVSQILREPRSWLRSGSNSGDAPGRGGPAALVFGIAGSLDPAVAAGDLLVPETWAGEGKQHSRACSDALFRVAQERAALIEGRCFRFGGVGVTVNAPVGSRSSRHSVASRYPGAIVCDMETHAVLDWLDGSECLSVRVISDDFASGGWAADYGIDSGRVPVAPPVSVTSYCSALAEFVYGLVTSLAAGGERNAS